MRPTRVEIAEARRQLGRMLTTDVGGSTQRRSCRSVHDQASASAQNFGAVSMPHAVLIADNDRDIAALVADVLREEGFVVAELRDTRSATIQAEVARLEPDIVLLDGDGFGGYGESWE